MIVFLSLVAAVWLVRVVFRKRPAPMSVVHRDPRIKFAAPLDPVVAWSVDFHKPYTPPVKQTGAQILAFYGYKA